MFVGGYGFASTKLGSMNLPLMDKLGNPGLEPNFLIPIAIGALYLLNGVLSINEKFRLIMLQVSLGVSVVFVVVTITDIIHISQLLSMGAYVPLNPLIRAEACVVAAFFTVIGMFNLRSISKKNDSIAITE